MKALDAAPQSSVASSLPYMPGLDVARGVAIFMVLVDHGLASGEIGRASRFMFGLQYVARFGHMGVHLFFILSGFLITGILMDSRTQVDYYRNFYTRRVLRILPAYLLMIVVLFATHSISVRYVAVCLLFVCNMPSLLGASPEYSPLWSLSVEEQFYLVWPVIVRRLSARGVAVLCIAILLAAPVLRFGLLYGPSFAQDVRFKTWAVADFFAAGALLAIVARLPHLNLLLHRAVPVLIFAGISFFTLQHVLAAPKSLTLTNLNLATYLEPWLLGLSGFVLLAFLNPGIAISAMARPWMFLAKISYGLYLCHVFVFSLVESHWHLSARTGSGVLPELLLRFFCECALAVGVAALSRYTFEEFFLRLKPKLPRTAHRYNAAEKIT